MALDYQHQVSLGLLASTHAQWLRDNPDWEELDEHGDADADKFGMAAMANGFLRAYYELIHAGLCTPLHRLSPPKEVTN